MSKQKTTLPIAVQLYTLRNLTLSLDEVLAQVAAIGYDGVETIGDHGLSAEAMQALLRKHNLQSISAHVGLPPLEANLDGIVAFHKAVGNRVLTIPALPGDRRPSDGPGWQQLGRELDALGQRCAAAGMQLLYHNHAWEMELFDGQRAVDWMLGAADPKHLQWEPDLAWIVRGGADPAQMLAQYAGRCPRVHVKDLSPEGEGGVEKGFADVGFGTLDWATLLPACQAAGAGWLIVEHDWPSDPIRTIRRSYEFLSSQLRA